MLPGLGRIVVMIDSDGDENYVPHVIPLDGGFPEPLATEAFAGGRSHLVHVDDDDGDRVLRGRVARGVLDDGDARRPRDRRGRESLWQSPYGAFVAAWTPDHSRVVLVDGYTMGDVVLYEIDDAASAGCSTERRSRSATPTQDYPLTGFRAAYGTASGAAACS